MTHISARRKSYVHRSWNHIPPTHSTVQSCSASFFISEPPILPLKSLMNSFSVIPDGALRPSKLRRKESATCVSVSFLPRAVSQMSAMSFMKRSMSKNCVIVDHTFVLRLATSSTLDPQFGWHEQHSPPKLG